MPLYDFACPPCGTATTLLLKHGEPGLCPTCGGEMDKLLAPFRVGGSAARDGHATEPKHEHGAAHDHIQAHAHSHTVPCTPAVPCRNSYVESVLKKYVP